MTPLSRFRAALTSGSKDDLLYKLQGPDQYGMRRVGISSMPDALVLHHVDDPNVGDPNAEIYSSIRITMSDGVIIQLHRGPDYEGNPAWWGPRAESQLTFIGGNWILSVPEGRNAYSSDSPALPWDAVAWVSSNTDEIIPVSFIKNMDVPASYVGQVLYTVSNGKWWRVNHELDWVEHTATALLLTDTLDQVWEVSVETDGTLNTTKVSGGTLLNGLVEHWPLDEEAGTAESFQLVGSAIATERASYFAQPVAGTFEPYYNHQGWSVVYNYIGHWDLLDALDAVQASSWPSTSPPWDSSWDSYTVTHSSASSAQRVGVFADINLDEVSYAFPGPPLVGMGRSFWPYDVSSNLINHSTDLNSALDGQSAISVHFWYRAEDNYDDAVLFELINSFDVGIKVTAGYGPTFTLIAGGASDSVSLTTSDKVSVGVVVDYAASEAYLYIDGVLSSQFSFTPESLASSALPWYLTVFGSTAGANTWVGGLIDSVSLWSRALSPAEQTALYNGGSGLTFAEF